MTREEVAEINPDALMCDGFDEAIIGMAERINLGPVVAYSTEKIIEILMRDMEVDEEDLEEGESIETLKYQMAYEHFEYNIKGAWMGEFTPVFITTEF
ncbi:MAG: hypothetical protein WCK82_03310 [Bacteroidota bacterium]|jgi:hypothetical protein